MSTPKISLHHKPLETVPAKYCRIILTEEKASVHRFIEAEGGALSYKMGVGKWSEVTPRTFRTIIRSIIQAAKGHQMEYIVIEPTAAEFPQLENQTDSWIVSTVVENLLLASYEFTKYKSKQKDTATELKEILIVSPKSKEIEAGFLRGLTVGTMVNAARDIANTPGDDMNPKQLGVAAKELAKGSNVTVKVLGLPEITKLKMGLLQAVGKGSHHDAQFIVMEYWGLKKPAASAKVEAKNKPLVLIGKGITYDTGGLNVKPAGGMHDMHMDMSGGSSVMAAIVAAAKLGIKKNIIALIPAAENAVSSTSMRAGDIATSLSGQTVEILHTDAEGRLVLADALTYSERYSPRAIIDVATLTGAALVALGQHASAVMTKDSELETILRKLGEESGDLVWPLPIWDEYKQHIKSNRADLSNISTNFSRYGGTIEGGTFLSHFAPKNVPWAHIDIAPRMDSIPSDKLAKGATGEPVRLLITFLEQY